MSRPAGRRAVPLRLIVAITGASGAAYGVRLLELLHESEFETHLVVSAAGWATVEQELGRARREIEALARVNHGIREIGATIASGSFDTLGMVVAPCSMKTLASIAHGMADNLVARAADVALKERRRLVLMVREAPLNLAHLRNMIAVTEMGAIVFPPVPAFYHRPRSIDEMIDQTCASALSLLGVAAGDAPQWPGLRASVDTSPGVTPT
ncbi:MAG: UbiX family flavin prenyltransferase [Gammaproteobacteria bacterium]